MSVRAVGESELLVEGKVEKKTEGTSISRSFRRRFVLPGMVKCEALTSALSADGVLTITAPKKVKRRPLQQFGTGMIQYIP